MTEVVLRVGILSNTTPGTGNATTIQRIANYLSDFDAQICDPDCPLEELNVVIVLHALHFFEVVMSLNPQAKIILIIGGTDANCCLFDEQKREKIRLVCDRANRIICFNVELMAKIEFSYGTCFSPKINLIPQAVDVTINLSTKSKASWKCKLGLSNFDVLLLLPASLRPVKDPGYILEEFQKYFCANSPRGIHSPYKKTDDPSIFLLLAGPILDEAFVRENPLLLELVDNHSYYPDPAEGHAPTPAFVRGCMYVGNIPRESLLELMAECDAVLNTSTSEGMSGALLEAMALGSIAVARDIEGNRSLVTHGMNGLLFDTPEACIRILDTIRQSKVPLPQLAACASKDCAYVAIPPPGALPVRDIWTSPPLPQPTFLHMLSSDGKYKLEVDDEEHDEEKIIRDTSEIFATIRQMAKVHTDIHHSVVTEREAYLQLIRGVVSS